MAERYRPSNMTEGDAFLCAWCYLCERDRAHREDNDAPGCPILGATMARDVDDPKYPSEWTIDEASGLPSCAAFVPAGEPLPAPRCEHTDELFPPAQVILPLVVHRPEEWGPSHDRRLTCSCGHPDPFHYDGASS